MNIFYLSNNQKECAIQHPDKHCVKMILEYAQLLSTAHRVLDGKQSTIIVNNRKKQVWKLNSKLDDILYTATHINHPSAVWVRQSSANYNWLAKMLFELCAEYTYRYNKFHKVEYSGLMESLLKTPDNIPMRQFTEPTPAMPDQYIISGNSIQSYRNYYNGAKQHLASWKDREEPIWFNRLTP